MKKHVFTLTTLFMVTLTISAQKLVGGDLSLVPAYEQAGDKWQDTEGNVINTYYDDGMITYVHEVAGWNAIRVRLLVDPSQDDAPATCQNLDYVKKLGKRIKDSGMEFLLDIFYSDTWTDVTEQWIPASWGYDKNTETTTLAAKVKSYTTEILNALNTYGAKPDYIQIGNEVSYGMLWDNASGASKNNWFVTSSTYDAQTANITRFATLLKAAAEGVRASDCSSAKIILHCERTNNNTHCQNFYNWVEKAGFTDYDIIGLSYYPIWHGDLNKLKATLNTLVTTFPTKEIQIVETGYQHTPPNGFNSNEIKTDNIWPYSPAGQAAFLKDLIATLNNYEKVTGLYYWQPEECGNGADEGGTNRVMGNWDNRGFWQITWKSGTHALNSSAALMTLKSFLSGGDDPQEKDYTDLFTNMDFESCVISGGSVTECPGWTITYDNWGSGPWPKAKDQWHSGLADGYLIQSWVNNGSALSAGNIIAQSSTLPAGTYTVTAVVHTDYDGICLFANDDTQVVPKADTWGTAYEVSVQTTLATEGSLTLGLKLLSKPTTSAEINLYADNFKIVGETTDIQVTKQQATINNNAWYTLSGQKLSSKPNNKGIYIHQGKKVMN